jgi:hypothetical protein
VLWRLELAQQLGKQVSGVMAQGGDVIGILGASAVWGFDEAAQATPGRRHGPSSGLTLRNLGSRRLVHVTIFEVCLGPIQFLFDLMERIIADATLAP